MYVTVSQTLFRSSGQLNKPDSDGILNKGDQLFKSLGKLRYLRIEDLPQEFFNFQKIRWEKLQSGYISFLL